MSSKPESILNSLRSRVWLAVCGLALANCIAGVAAYLIGTLVLSSPLIPVLFAFALATIVTLIYGRWLADEVVRPVKKVNLALKSIERNPTAQLPSATGSSETDEILISIQRNNRQFVNLITLMDRAAAGDTQGALQPLESSDRITNSFQKLVGKVADSIDALERLEAMRLSIRTLANEASRIDSFRTIDDLNTESEHTADLARALNGCLARLAAEMHDIRSEVTRSAPIAEDAGTAVRSSREALESTVESISSAISSIKAGERSDPAGGNAGIEGLAEARSAEAFPSVAEKIREAAERAALPRRHSSELQRLMRRLRERASALAGVIRSVDDISRRVKLVSLNSSLSSAGGPIEALADEFKTMAERADRLKKEIADLERAIGTEIGDCESAVRELISSGSDLHIAVGNSAAVLTDLVPAIEVLASVPAKAAALNADQARSRENVLRALSSGFFDLENCLPRLRSAEQKISTLCDAVRIEPLPAAINDVSSQAVPPAARAPEQSEGETDR